MDNLLEELFKTLRKLTPPMKKYSIKWCIGSSLSLYLQNIKVTPKDIDIVIEKTQFNDFLNILKNEGYKFSIKNFVFGSTPFQKVELEDQKISISFVFFDLSKATLVSKNLESTNVFLRTLHDELEFYKGRRGKEDIVEMIQKEIGLL